MRLTCRAVSPWTLRHQGALIQVIEQGGETAHFGSDGMGGNTQSPSLQVEVNTGRDNTGAIT